jgi:uncharacterized membrane protein YedE/YeeE
MDEMTLAALLGLGGGCILGLAARLGQFCTFGAIESAYMGHDQRRMRLWGIVLGVAILAIYTLNHLGHMDVSRTIYHTFQWNPLASIIGGLMFGYGMGLAGNCGFGALARFGGGDLRSFVVVLIIGISGYFILSGPLASTRVAIFPTETASTAQGFTGLGETYLALPPMVTATVIAIAMLIWALSHAPLRGEHAMLFWGIMAGLSVAGVFWGTTFLNDASVDQVPIQGHTFTAPSGDTLLYLMTGSGGGLGFSVGSVTGVLLGAFIGSMIKGHFRWEPCDDPRELGRQVLGAVFMGFGGAIAVGCSVGQGISAFSTLSYSGPVTLACIVIGCMISIRQLLAGFEP